MCLHSDCETILECRTLHGCATGDAKITRGYDLPAKCIFVSDYYAYGVDVLHAVGPIGENPTALTSW
jgi:hypothetical protein